jgi:ATP-dependent DNA helicase RecG
MILNRDIKYLKGVGPKRAEILREESGIETVEDIIYHSPRRYLDRSTILKIAECNHGEQVTITGTVSQSFTEGGNRRRLRVVVSDKTDELSGIFFGGISYYQKLFEPGDRIIFSGKVEVFRGEKQIIHPEYDFFETDPAESVQTGRIIPVYPLTEKLRKAGFTSRVLRRLIHAALEETVPEITDPLPPEIIAKRKLKSLGESLYAIHFPQSFEDLNAARSRLAYNELFFLQYYLALSRSYFRLTCNRTAKKTDGSILDSFIKKLPFELTNDQKKAILEISDDLANPFPMNRLLQGDVGSGKTVVALASCLLMLPWNRQCAVMAPTEILARQHYLTFSQFVPDGVSIAILTGSTPTSDRKEILSGIDSGSIQILIGTHALIEDQVQFSDLGLIIIDEQHRFGVTQRSALHQKGESPDILVMSATPIPRSLTLTLYGDLDLTLIKEKPKNRLPVKTLVLPEAREQGLFASMEKYISEGRQCFYVLPLIKESEKIDLESANSVYERFSNEIFRHRRVALLHGKLSQSEKESVMNGFKAGSFDILVSTTVIEVGIDIPNATVIVIHHPERFGLSQLHQLRGRVGRGAAQSFCILFHPDSISRESRDRLAVMERTDDGFIIAEEDLRIRGAGDYLGTRQHGESASFEFADLSLDYQLLLSSREDAIDAATHINDIENTLNEIRRNDVGNRYITGTRLSKALSLIS